MNNEQKIADVRNKVAGKLKKWDRPIFGYKSSEPDRAEGDVWTDADGKEWTIKNGIRQSISRLDGARVPLFCPSCKKIMNHRFDTKFYNLYQECYNCTIERHTQMRINGTWETFERKQMRENEKSFLRDAIAERKDYIRTFKPPQIHFSNGGWESIAHINHFRDMLNEVKRDIEFCEMKLKQLEDEDALEESTNE